MIYYTELHQVMYSSEEDAFIKSQVKHAGQDLVLTKKANLSKFCS